MNAEQWNAMHPVGTLVFAYPGCRPEHSSDARRIVTKTRTEAKSVGLERDGVVWVEDHGAYISLTHVDPVSESVWQAAKEAEETAAAVATEGALPVPVGDQPQPLDDTRLAEIREHLAATTNWSIGNLAARDLLAEVQRLKAELASAQEDNAFLERNTLPELRRTVQHHQDGKKRWRARAEKAEARVAELEAERHTTNEALSDAAETLRANRDRIAELEENLRAVTAGWGVARARVAELERPAVEAKRNEIRQSFTELAAQAEQDRDFEGAFDIQGRLRDREEQWKREDEGAA